MASRTAKSQQDKAFEHPLHCSRCRAGASPGSQIKPLRAATRREALPGPAPLNLSGASFRSVRHIAGLVAAGLILAGCSTADAKDIRTSGIKADFLVTVKDHERRADVLATLRAGTLTFVKLGDGESVNVSGSGSAAELRRTKNLGVTNY